jgi:hypothetical protein
MSLAAMTEVALQRRPDFGTPDRYPRTLAEHAAAAAGKTEPASTIDTVLRTISTYIPSEILTVYVSALAALATADTASELPHDRWVTFWGFLVATPIVVWLVYAGRLRSASKPLPLRPTTWPVWEMVAATIAYAAWAYGLPGSAFGTPKLASIVVLITSTVLGLLAPVFAGRQKT